MEGGGLEQQDWGSVDMACNRHLSVSWVNSQKESWQLRFPKGSLELGVSQGLQDIKMDPNG